MSTQVNIVNSKTKIVFGDENIVIQKYISGIAGGRALDMTDWTEESVKAGHVIIKNASGDYAPLAVTDGYYTALPEGASYAGILVHSMLKTKPAASIMTWGVVNKEAMPYKLVTKSGETETSFEAAFLTACPHIEFTADNI